MIGLRQRPFSMFLPRLSSAPIFPPLAGHSAASACFSHSTPYRSPILPLRSPVPAVQIQPPISFPYPIPGCLAQACPKLSPSPLLLIRMGFVRRMSFAHAVAPLPMEIPFRIYHYFPPRHTAFHTLSSPESCPFDKSSTFGIIRLWSCLFL